MKTKNRYFSTIDGTVNFSICKVKKEYHIYSAFSKLDLMSGKGLFENDFLYLRDALKEVKRKINVLEIDIKQPDGGMLGLEEITD